MSVELDPLGWSRWFSCLEICADGQIQDLQERQAWNTQNTASPLREKAAQVCGAVLSNIGGELWVRIRGEARQGNFVQGILQTWSGGSTG